MPDNLPRSVYHLPTHSFALVRFAAGGLKRHWQSAGVALALLVVGSMPAWSATTDSLVQPEYRLSPAAPGWGDLSEAFAQHPDITATFTERRFFPFRAKPVELGGEVRFSATRGLSLHYTAPQKHTVIIDAEGMLVRAAEGEKAPPADARAGAANAALLLLLRFDLIALNRDFEIFGQREGTAWTLVLVPRAEELRRSVGRIGLAGEAATIRRIELRQGAKQSIEIVIGPPRPTAAYSTEELSLFFR